MLTKKYFTIAEVSEISGLPTHKLRYIEKSDSNIEIVKIRGRRYYTKNNIAYIRKTYSAKPIESVPISNPVKSSNFQIIVQIDLLHAKFQKLLG